MHPSHIANIIDFLKEKTHLSWMTSETIKSKLKITDYNAAEIEKGLLDYYNVNSNSAVRYSSLPSKRSLQVLWGHVDNVGHRKLFDIFKEDNHLEADYLNEINDERNLFLSHSFKDTSNVFDLAKHLVTHGINPWIAETDITQNSHINHDVISAINDLPFFGMYLSEHVLTSAWSVKEFEFALSNKKKLFGFVHEDNHEMINLIENNISSNHHDIHDLLRKAFDRGDFSEHMVFFEIPRYENTNTKNHLKIKPLKTIIEHL